MSDDTPNVVPIRSRRGRTKSGEPVEVAKVTRFDNRDGETWRVVESSDGNSRATRMCNFTVRCDRTVASTDGRGVVTLVRELTVQLGDFTHEVVSPTTDPLAFVDTLPGAVVAAHQHDHLKEAIAQTAADAPVEERQTFTVNRPGFDGDPVIV